MRRLRGFLGVRLKVEVGPLLDARVYEHSSGGRVPVLAHGCCAGKVGRMAYGVGHAALGSFGVDSLGEIDPPAGYARAARARAGMARTDRPGF